MKFALRVALGLIGFVVALLLVLAAIGATYQPNLEIAKGFPGHHVQVAGVPLRVLQRGSGRDVLLIHGSPGCIEDWTPVIDGLASGFRVTAYDRPGHGFSGDQGTYSLEYNARMAAAVIDALQLKNAIVAGHSYGGATALALALRAPPQVAGYVLVDSGAYTPPRAPDASYALLAAPFVGMGVATLLGPRLAPERVRAGTLQLFAPRKPPAGFVELRAGLFSTPKVVHALALEARGAAEGLAAQSPSYPTIGKPLHIIAQADDPFRRNTARRLQREVPGATLQLIHGTGHYVQIEKTAEVVAAIRTTDARAR
jgi:pimeloyl-ACP methyl ester carboxylesterase